ncbi:hypothetical protein UFOVP84_21 [uncultured Caudovirales phage]|uniref:Uncharacterized protein n=1 Tax=uncultured Caudovirales phage TaxID=2100421 RepID=A0A6J5KXL3_9CAUD|nr:hypothetical protein UFOVP84_21 [uncultured Caudovirales phage]
MSNSLFKNIGHNSIADGLYKDIASRSTRYYHSFGKTSAWINDPITPQVIDSLRYERVVRDEIIAMKEISPADVSYVIPRIDWTSGTIYDEYDDSYSSEIRGINLSAGGNNYTSPIITIGLVCPTSTLVLLNSQYFYVYSGVGYLYTVTTAGTTGSSNSTALGATTPIIGTAYVHGSAVLTCVGFQATATANLGTGTTATTIISITMTNNGYGYTILPNVYITDNSGAGAAVNAVMVLGQSGVSKLENTNYYVYNTTDSNIYVCVDNNNGATSTSIPSTVSGSVFTTADGYQWKYMSSVSINNKFLTSSYLPVITASKNQYTATGSISGVSIDNAGSGYTSATIITVIGDGAGAILTPVLTSGAITDVIITNAGSGYSYANLILSSEGTSGSLSASVFLGSEQNSLQASSESSVIFGNILNAQVVSGGYGYSLSPTVNIVGDGLGATAIATVISGKISSITFTNRGKNYNWANIIITDSTGYGASIRAIISPYGGLGKDPINQLYAKSLMLYSKINNNTNQGFYVTNDYRQIGIIKDPLRYSDGTYLKANFASTCWEVIATTIINTAQFALDTIITTYIDSITYSFRVAYISGSSILLVPIDNGTPDVGIQFNGSSGGSFIAVSVIPPSVDKYSGDLMLIDNEAAFVGNSVVVRSVINL